MKKIIYNLRPFEIYLVSWAIFILVSLLSENISTTAAAVFLIIIYSVLGIVLGFYADIKEMKFGLIAYEIVMAVLPLLGLIAPLVEFSALSAAFYSIFAHGIDAGFNIPAYIFSIIMPILPIALGFVLKKAVSKKHSEK